MSTEESRGGQIYFVLPSLDPDDRILSLADELQAASPDGAAIKLLVVDDGSCAEKQNIFKQLESRPFCTVLHHHMNQGKGAALKTAFQYLLDLVGDDLIGCVTADGDGQHRPEDIHNAARYLVRYPDELILGCRTFDHAHVPWKSRFGNNLTRFMFCSVLHVLVSDTQTGLRGIPASFMKECLALRGNRFEFETEMLLLTRKTGTEIREFPIATVYFDANSGTHFHPIKDACRIYGVILRFLFAELFRYIIVAVSSFLLDNGLFGLFFYFVLAEKNIRWNLPWGECDPTLFLSYLIARGCSSLWNYFGNRLIVFRTGRYERAPLFKSLGEYYLLCVTIFLSSWLLTAGISHFVQGKFVIVAKICVDLLLFFVAFFTQKFVIFRRRGKC